MSETLDVVLATLRQASSQIPEEFKPAELTLESWQTQPGFYSTLVEIFSEYSLEVNVRWMAVLYFKNGVDMYWRKTAPKAISEDEKKRIRAGLLKNLREPVPQVAIQLAVLISKLGRVDCPREWPELLPTLFAGIKTDDDLVRERTLLTLHHVVKQLASKRLANDRRVFQDLTSQMFTYLFDLWREETNSFLSPSANYPTSLSYFQRSHLTLKVLRKLTIYGFKNPHSDAQVVALLGCLYEKICPILQFRKKFEGDELVRKVAEKYAVLLTKVFLDLLENHPFSFLAFIEPSLELVLRLIFGPAGEGLLFQRFVVQCLNLLRNILVCPEYKTVKNSEGTNINPSTLEAQRIKRNFFHKEILVGMCNKLVTCYLPLNNEDISFWESDPEGYSLELEGGESWRYSLRPCIESLFVSLFHEFRDDLTPPLQEMVNACQVVARSDDFHSICQKDAVYNAIGLSAFDLFDEVDFDRLFTETLIKELQIKDSNYRILRRRGIWLIGKWIGVKLAVSNRPKLYEACIHLLSRDEDFVVRITAAMTLKSAIDDFEFKSDHFMAYLPSTFELLFDLLKDSHECDTKMQVLCVMSFMIEMIGAGIQPYAGPLLQYLPALWDESTEHNMLRCAILSTLVVIVQGLTNESEKLHSFVLPIIAMATDANQECHIYLLEDALHLWLTTLENCQTPSEALLSLFSNMTPLLEYSSENLRLCLQITNAYILFCPELFLERYGERLVSACRFLMTDLKNEGLVLVLKTIEMMIRVRPTESSKLLRPLLPSIIEPLTGSSVYPMLLSMYLSIAARLVLYEEETFTWALSVVASNSCTTFETALSKILLLWSERMSLVSPEERRKLCALGLSRICAKNWPPVLAAWGAAVTSIGEVIFDITVEDSTDDKLVCAEGGSYDEYDIDTQHWQRVQALSRRDPVHTTPLRSFLAQELKVFEASVGADVVSNLFSTLEDDCKRLLREITS